MKKNSIRSIAMVVLVICILAVSILNADANSLPISQEVSTFEIFDEPEWSVLYRNFIENKEYIDTFKENFPWYSANTPPSFALYDLDSNIVGEDGIPELFIKQMEYDGVFTIKDGLVSYLGSMGMGAGYVFYNPDSASHGLYVNGSDYGNHYYGHYGMVSSKLISSHVVTYTYLSDGYEVTKISDEILYNRLLECVDGGTDGSLPVPRYYLDFCAEANYVSMTWDEFVEKYGFRLFRLDRDANSFVHTNKEGSANIGFEGITNHELDKEYLARLKELCDNSGDRNRLTETINNEWHGSCRGVSFTMGKLYNQDLTLDDLTDSDYATCYYNINKDDKTLHNMIEYYYLAQVTTKGANEYNTLAQTAIEGHAPKGSKKTVLKEDEFLKYLTEKADGSEVYGLGFDFMEDETNVEGGHTILIIYAYYDYSINKHIVVLYDQNSVNGGELGKEKGSFTYLIINDDYSDFVAKGESEKYLNSYLRMQIIDLRNKEIDFYSSDDEDKKDIASTGSADLCDIEISLNHPFELRNSADQTFAYDGELFTGDMPLYKKLFIGNENGVIVQLTVDKGLYNLTSPKEVYARISDNENYHSVRASGFTSATLSLSDGVTVNGDKFQFAIYTATKKYTNEFGDGVLVKVSGNAEKSVSVNPGYNDVMVSTGKKLTNVSVTDYIDNQSCGEIIGTVSKSRVIPNLALAYGDIDGDGEITLVDATLLQYYLAHVKDLAKNQLIASDVNADDEIGITDATVIQRYECKIIDKIGLDYLNLKEQ